MNDIRPGTGLLLKGEPFIVTSYQHVKPGKGSAFVRAKVKSIKTGSIQEKTFRSSDKLEDIQLEEKKIQYLYRSGDTFHFMDQETFEEVHVTEDHLGDDQKFLLDHLDVVAIVYNGQVQAITLPNFITSEIIETEPGFKGDTSRAGNKPAKIENGTQIQVPLFIEIGERVKIDTRSGEYVERVKQ